MMKKAVLILISGLFILSLCSCSDNKYGEPTTDLERIEEVTVSDVKDYVLFTYVSYSNERIPVLVNINDGRQYKLDELGINIDSFTTTTYYSKEAIIFFDINSQSTVILKVGDNHKFEVLKFGNDLGFLMGVNAQEQTLVFDNWNNKKIIKCDLQNNCSTITEYISLETGENDEVLGFYSYVDNKIFYFGRLHGEENRIAYFASDSNEWIEMNNLGLDPDNKIFGRFISSEKYPNYVMFMITDKENQETKVVEQFDEVFLIDVFAQKRIDAVMPFVSYYWVKSEEGYPIGVHERNTVISTIDMSPTGINVAEEYEVEAILDTKIPRINQVLYSSEDKLVFSTPEGLFVLDKNSQEITTLIFMDVDNQ